jgi:hypothetical protein
MLPFVRSVGLALAASILWVGCSGPTDTAVANVDESAAVATLGSALYSKSLVSAEGAMVDESGTTASASGTGTVVASYTGARALSTSTTTVTHSLANYTVQTASTLGADVVTVVRTWTNGDGQSVTETTVRPEIPSAKFFAPVPAQNFDPTTFAYQPASADVPLNTTPGLTWNALTSSWTVKAIQTRQVDNVVLSAVTMSYTYVVDSNNAGGTPKERLTQIQKQGEQVGLNTGNVKLTTNIWYAWNGTKNAEYLRTLDYVDTTKKTGVSTLKREVYAWGLTSLTGLPVSNGSLDLTPVPAVLSPNTTFDFVYQTDPTVPVSTYAPAFVNGTGTTLSSLPALDTGLWLRVVLQESAPRISDWYKPVNSGTAVAPVWSGTYLRRFELSVAADGSQTRQNYGSDGVTPVTSVVALKTRTVGTDGTVTTTWTFSNGKTESVSVKPVADSSGNLAYTITRTNAAGTQTYTVAYVKDVAGEVTEMDITLGSGSVSKFLLQANGTWLKS